MKRFLVIAQDLKLYGTSEGIVSRSFIAKLRKTYPEAVINLLYLKDCDSSDELELLPVDAFTEIIVDRTVPKYIIALNWAYWRLFHYSLKDKTILNRYRKELKKIEYQKYDCIFLRSAGQGFETVLASKDLPLLGKSIINFHDPYPNFWDTGSQKQMDKLELFALRKMERVVRQSRSCISPSLLLSKDLQFLYGSNSTFHTLPHQFDPSVFPVLTERPFKTENIKVVICYHGVVHLTRNIEILLEAYLELIQNNRILREGSEMILRIKGNVPHLKKKYECENIRFLKTVIFAKSAFEQQHIASILIVLENCGMYSNILVGKAPFLAFLKKPFLSLSPPTSEMRRIVQKDKYIATCNNKKEIKDKLKKLILDSLKDDREQEDRVFIAYFKEEDFKRRLMKIIDE